MKRACVLMGSVLLLCAFAAGQNNAPEAGQVTVGPGAPPRPNVFFHTQKLGEAGVSGTFVSLADNQKPVTGAPYTATATTETTQVLADGNRIVNKTSALLARDSQGRTRREENMGNMGPLAVKAPKMAFIHDPVSKTHSILDLTEQTATVMKPGVMATAVVRGKPEGMPTGPVRMFRKQVQIMDSGMPEAGMERRIVVLGGDDGQVKTESLGERTIEGVTAEGKRMTRTIPAGQIGNERPLEITSEVWTSPELQVTVLSKRNDPRFGETVYRLTNINREEPDPALFQVPGNFTVRNAGKGRGRPRESFRFLVSSF